MKKKLKNLKWIRIIMFLLLCIALVIIILSYKQFTGRVIEIINNIR